MSSIPSYNTRHLDALGRYIKVGVAGLVGAGTSIACGYPGWDTFVNALEAPLQGRLKDEYLAELRQRDIRTRLDAVASHLEDDYPRIFKETFEPRSDRCETPEWIRLIFDLPLWVVLTTNYTSELEVVSRIHPLSPLGSDPKPVRWYDAAGVAGALRRSKGHMELIYVHGRYDDLPGIKQDAEGREWSPVILGEKSYRYAYEYPGILKERFKAVCQTFTLLVIGASLRDEDLTGTLRFVRALSGQGAPPHYALLPLQPGEEPERVGSDYIQRFGLQPIFYQVAFRPNGLKDHGTIGDLLRDIVQRAQPTATLRATSVCTDEATIERVSEQNLLEHPPDRKQAEIKLKGVPRWQLRPPAQHKAIRMTEQHAFREALSTNRAVWLVADWELGKDGFLFSAMQPEEGYDLQIFRLNCEEMLLCEEALLPDAISAETQKQFHMTFQEFCANVSALPSTCLVLDNLPEADTTHQGGGWTARLETIVQVAVEWASTIKIILTSRRPPNTCGFKVIQLRPLDEPDCARYIEAHPYGGRDLLGPRVLERLYAMSEGVPVHLDRMLRALQTISIEDLWEIEQESKIQSPLTEPIPRALVQAVSVLEHSTEKYTRRSFRLLKVLTILSQGETFKAIRKFDPEEPFYPSNVEELRALGLLEAGPLVEAGPQFGLNEPYGRVDAASPKLLHIPRQVRDYVRSQITEDERHTILQKSLDLYFGPRWREGKISLPPVSELRVRDGMVSGPGNRHVVTLSLLHDSISRGDDMDFHRVFLLADAYLNSLKKADRFRDTIAASQGIFQVLENARKRPEAAKIALLYGESLRMLGHHEESIRILDKALQYAPPEYDKAWQASVYLDLALAHESLKDREAAIAAAKAVLERTKSHSGQAYQAKSIILTCKAGEIMDQDTFAELADIEQKTRKKGNFIVANNIALDLAAQSGNPAIRSNFRERVLETKEDVYNRIRAVVAKSEELIEEGRQGELARQERRFLSESYSYLYSQRLSSLFDRCHKVIWELASTDGQVPVLVRLFRFSSFLWRVFGETEREKQYLRQLEGFYTPGPQEKDQEEVTYYLARVRVLHE